MTSWKVGGVAFPTFSAVSGAMGLLCSNYSGPTSVSGPVDEYRLARDARLLDGAEVTGILGIGAVVPHDPQAAFGHRVGVVDGKPVVGRQRVGRLAAGVGLVLQHAIYIDAAVAQIDGLAAHGDDALDEDAAALLRIGVLEGDDVAGAGSLP